MNKNNNSLTFAQKLNKQSGLLMEVGSKIQILISDAQKAMHQEGNSDKADKLLTEAELLLKEMEDSTQGFESKHSKEFAQFEHLFNCEADRL